MLKVCGGSSYISAITQYQKQNDFYLIPQSQVPVLQQAIDQIVYQKFGYKKSQTVGLIQRVVKNLLSLQVSIPLLVSLFETLKKQDDYIKQIKNYFLSCQNILLNEFQEAAGQNLQLQISTNPIVTQFDINQHFQDQSIKEDRYLSETCEFGSPNISQEDHVDCEFWNTSDRFFDLQSKHQNLNRSSMSQKKAKLKIQGLVASFAINCRPKQGEQQIKNWQKQIKKSILHQKNWQDAVLDLVPQVNRQNYLKQLHYRNKIKNTKLKNRLSKNLL